MTPEQDSGVRCGGGHRAKIDDLGRVCPQCWVEKCKEVDAMAFIVDEMKRQRDSANEKRTQAEAEVNALREIWAHWKKIAEDAGVELAALQKREVAMEAMREVETELRGMCRKCPNTGYRSFEKDFEFAEHEGMCGLTHAQRLALARLDALRSKEKGQ